MSAAGLVWPSNTLRSRRTATACATITNVDRTPFDDGLVRQERRYASALTALSITALLASDADYAALPRVGRLTARTAGLHGRRLRPARVHQVRVRGGAGGIEYTARVGGDGRRAWEAALVIEGVGL